MPLHNVQSIMLQGSLPERKRKADTDTQRRKQQKLLQAEQLRAIECVV